MTNNAAEYPSVVERVPLNTLCLLHYFSLKEKIVSYVNKLCSNRYFRYLSNGIIRLMGTVKGTSKSGKSIRI